ncbi:hypothetical protein VNI00_012722 [Paramarasmius palmivorus]|uniref:F-box domain-containing protein n=1 Tax=Paramarasmius palmivorus TaxID=297713 RepID=A0AAW0C4M2_9AGAR
MAEKITQYSLGKNPDDRIAELERQILEDLDIRAKLDARIRHNREVRNSYTLTHRLPFDILSGIFVIYIQGEEERTWEGYSKLDPNRFSCITHVCRHWRIVALGTPILWCNPDFRFPRMAEEMLKRSGRAPLEICVLSAEGTALMTKTLSSEFERTSALHISCPEWPVSKTLIQLSQPAPILKRLVLDGSQSGYRYAVALPRNFLGGRAPELRHLYLNCFRVPLISPVYRNLASVAIGLMVHSSVPDLLLLLSETMELQSLSLWGSLSSLDSIDRGIPQLVFSPRLKHACLSFQIRHLETLLHHMVFPETTSVKIDCTFGRYAIGDKEKLAALSTMALDVLHPGHIISIQAAYTEDRRSVLGEKLPHTIDIWTSNPIPGPITAEFCKEPCYLQQPTVPRLRIGLGWVSMSMGEAIEVVFPTSILNHLQSFENKSTRKYEDDRVYPESFKFLPRLAVLTLMQHGAVTTFARSAKGPEADKYPALQRIQIVNINYTLAEWDSAFKRQWNILKWLHKWCVSGRNVSLTFSGCDFTSTQRSYLKLEEGR